MCEKLEEHRINDKKLSSTGLGASTCGSFIKQIETTIGHIAGWNASSQKKRGF